MSENTLRPVVFQQIAVSPGTEDYPDRIYVLRGEDIFYMDLTNDPNMWHKLPPIDEEHLA